MSQQGVSSWLLSHSSSFQDNHNKKLTTTISVTSGKGGVGKTSVAVKIAKMLAEQGHKTLLIDCDYNLSNTHLKLGLPVSNNFSQLVRAEKSFEECLFTEGNFSLLPGCNGDLELFEKGIDLARLVIDIIAEHEAEFEYIILDCPAGLSKDAVVLNAYSDYRFMVVTPDKSSITDSYSLMKILNQKFGICENHLIVNKISSEKQYQRIVKILSETVEQFLKSRLKILGGIEIFNKAVDLFDNELMSQEKNVLNSNFSKIVTRFMKRAEEISEAHLKKKAVHIVRSRAGMSQMQPKRSWNGSSAQF